MDADLFVVLAYGEILRQEVLDLPRMDCINLHASLLPRWRGASPLQSVLRAGDEMTGVSVMRMVAALDAGAVYLKHNIPLDDTSTLPWLHDTLAECSAAALNDFLQQAQDVWPLACEEQDESLVTWCHKLTSDHGHLDLIKMVHRSCASCELIPPYLAVGLQIVMEIGIAFGTQNGKTPI